MKKLMFLAIAAALLSACNNDAENASGETDTTTTSTVMVEPSDNTVSSRTPGEGDVTYREHKVQVWKGGAWVDADDDVKMDNGVVVYRTGKVTRDGKEIEMEEGVVVDRSGNIFDRTGNAVESAWDHTKEGAKKAGHAVGDAAEEVGHKVKDAVDGDHDNDEKK